MTTVGDERLLDSLTTANGTGIDFSRLATVIAGMLAGSFFGGWAAVIGAFFQTWLIDPLLGLGQFIDRAITDLGFGLASIGFTAWRESTAFAFTLGIFAPVFAFGLYLGISYIVAQIRREVSG